MNTFTCVFCVYVFLKNIQNSFSTLYTVQRHSQSVSCLSLYIGKVKKKKLTFSCELSVRNVLHFLV